MPLKPKITKKDALEELVRRGTDLSTLAAPKANARTDHKFLKGLFRQQREFVEHPSRRKALLGSRQCGKSTLACAYLAKVALETPRASCLYLGVSRQKAKELIWGDLQEYNKNWSLGFEFNEAELTAYHPDTESRIYLRGCDSKHEKEKVLGGRYSLVCVDEAQLIGAALQDFVNRILVPATLAKKGTIALFGTPSPKPFGFFYDLTNETSNAEGWQIFKWTIRENPYIPDIDQQLAEILKQNRWDTTNPTYQREYCGKWVTSHELLAFKFDYIRNTIKPEDLPTDLTYSLGIDFGNNDPTAIVVAGTRDNDQNFYVVDAWLESNVTTSDAATIIEGYREKYTTQTMIGDTGGIGKAYVEEYRKHYKLPIRVAYKKRDITLDLLNDDLLTGKLKIVSDPDAEPDAKNKYIDQLIEELCCLQWKDPNSYSFEAGSDHLVDALRYCHGISYHYAQGNRATRTLDPRIAQRAELDAELDRIIAKDKEDAKTPWWKRQKIS